MTKCPAITRNKTACKGRPIDDTGYCYSHHPAHTEERRQHGSRGGRRGGRGRPTSELHRLGKRFEELADQVLAGEIERGVGAVAGQLLNGARACIRDAMAAREQEELIERLDALEAALEEERGEYRWGA